MATVQFFAVATAISSAVNVLIALLYASPARPLNLIVCAAHPEQSGNELIVSTALS